MQLDCEAPLPLCVGHLEQVNLRDRSRDVEQGVDPAERRNALLHHGPCGIRLRQVRIDHQRIRASSPDRLGCLL